ncbi:MAG: GntR family transcriptional regulator [Lachnospiraceae bacterium]|nr:GntR family transcriptional regulator [Lachnospiraceae bacterium]
MANSLQDTQIIENLEIPMRNPGEKWSDYIFRILYQNIMDLTLYPGMPLNEPALAGRFGCSRTPIREAFFRLQERYLVDIFPQCGIFVSPIDYHIIREMQFMRAAVESQMMVQLCEQIDPEDLARLESNLALQKRIAEIDPSGKKFFPVDQSFHELLFDAANYPLVREIMTRGITHTDRLTYLLILRGLPYQDRSLDEHQRMYDSLVRKDSEEAVRLVYQHRMEYRNLPPVKGLEHYFRNSDA